MASQSSSSGWLGHSPCAPKSSTVLTRPVPKNICQERLTATRAVSGCAGVDQPAGEAEPVAASRRQRRQAAGHARRRHFSPACRIARGSGRTSRAASASPPSPSSSGSVLDEPVPLPAQARAGSPPVAAATSRGHAPPGSTPELVRLAVRPLLRAGSRAIASIVSGVAMTAASSRVRIRRRDRRGRRRSAPRKRPCGRCPPPMRSGSFVANGLVQLVEQHASFGSGRPST